MKIGVCADPSVAPVLAVAGFDFLELHVQNHLKTTVEDEAAFLPELARIRAASLPCVAANNFVPGNLKITGPDVNRNDLAAYAAVTFARAAQVGIDTIVFGSGGARRIPDDFERDVAWQQLVEFGKLIGPLAQQYGLVVVVEPLNQRECNVLTSVAESGRYVEDVDHPNVRLLVDAYHWLQDDNDGDAIVTYGPLLRHVHIATAATRRAPGVEDCDFTDFFRALKASGYDGRISIESGWGDMAVEAPLALATLQRLLHEAGW
ncbi:MAG TPA: sugar phosphate isomerase/epimerase family protein [Anaerolineae bacterium]|nr:sugar phosphate isomerase/epimerase family protein [Anaerolineae bacterium]HQH38330.1 sugar phosphate isomerase/epimerase family protein [Anaerolineae bacterium]